jgi:predicted nucleic acid-binding Zn ribbon protein
MKMQKCPHCSKEIIYSSKVCSYCMQTIGVEHKVKTSSVGNWVIVFIVVVCYYLYRILFKA